MQKRFLGIVLAITAFLSWQVPSALTYSPVVSYYRFEKSHHLGGFSGLVYLGRSGKNNQEMRFLTQNDPGPEAQANTTALRWIELETDSQKNELKKLREVSLTDPKGLPLTGADLDPEGLTIDNHGNVWMCEELGPSLLKFNRDGKLLKRYIPANSMTVDQLRTLEKAYGPNVVLQSLPEDFSIQKTHRGFEGITYANGKIYTSLQKPLGKKDSTEDSIRMLEFDIDQQIGTSEFSYPLNVKDVKKVGDLAYSPADNYLYLIEQNSETGAKAQHFLSRVQISKKNLKPQQLANLSLFNYAFAEKIEGLAFIQVNTFAFINDNDFNPDVPIVLGIIRLAP